MLSSTSHPHVVRLPISRSALGDARFERTFQAVRFAANLLSGRDCQIEATYENYERSGYIFGFRTPMQMLRLRLYYDSVMLGRPLALRDWA